MISKLLIKDIKTIKDKNTIQYISVTIRFLFRLSLTKSLSSKSDISLSPSTG